MKKTEVIKNKKNIIDTLKFLGIGACVVFALASGLLDYDAAETVLHQIWATVNGIYWLLLAILIKVRM